jgi:hypothetical protein
MLAVTPSVHPNGSNDMMLINKALLSAAMAAGVCAFSAVGASAAVVCTEDNVCWHSKERHTYPPDARITIHEDNWKAGPSIRFREHEGRGYWRGDRWTDF